MGETKVEAFIASIKENVRGPITILFPENAHARVLSMHHDQDYQKAVDITRTDAQALEERFRETFQGCSVTYWNNFILADPEYPLFKEKIMHLAQTDRWFQESLQADAHMTYTAKQAEEFPDKTLYISQVTQDLLEQAVYVLVTAKHGYRFDFYPGKPYASSEYVNQKFVAPEKQLQRINVSLRFKKKEIHELL